MKINLNDKVKFRPTKLGMQVLEQKHNAIFSSQIPFKTPKTDANGYMETEIWQFMNNFGSHMFNGVDVPVETEVFVKGERPLHSVVLLGGVDALTTNHAGIRGSVGLIISLLGAIGLSNEIKIDINEESGPLTHLLVDIDKRRIVALSEKQTQNYIDEVVQLESAVMAIDIMALLKKLS